MSDPQSTSSPESFPIDVDTASTTGLAYGTGAAGAATLVLAHGAGAPQTHPWLVAMARAIAARGLQVVTFNFLYSEARRRVPDKNDLLEATWRAALREVRTRAPGSGARLFIGGKSMGGRIASQVAARGEEGLSGLVLLGFPLHPPGKTEVLRAAHLPRVAAPMLFVQGSRDAFGTPEELGPIVRGLSEGSRLFVVEGGDHSFALSKSRAAEKGQVIARVADEVACFTASR